MQLANAYIDTHRDRFLRTLLRYLAQPSISATGEGIADAATLAADMMRSVGLAARIIPTPGAPVVVGRCDGPDDATHVLIYGHYDVQPPGPVAEWNTPPFVPDIRDGRVYGRGTGDNKGQHLAHLLAVEVLNATGGLPCTVTVLLDGEEEIGSPHLTDFVDTHRDLLDADLVLWSDGPVHEDGHSCVSLGVRGIVKFALRATGASYPTHSGNWGGVAPNPAWRLVHMLSSMRGLDGGVLIPGFYADVRPYTQAEAAALNALPVDLPTVYDTLKVTQLDPPAERGYHERLAQWPTLTINTLSTEDAGEHRTVVPSVAVAGCDIRTVGDQRCDRVVAQLREHIARVDPELELTVLATVEPSRTPLATPFIEAIRSGTAAAFGEDPYIVPALGGSLPLHPFTGVLGLPCYGVPLANVDEANHAPNENLELWRFFTGIRASVEILTRLGHR